MKYLSIALVLALAAACASAADLDGNVKVFTADNFDAGLEESKLTLVEFYAPWCGHCKALAPEYAKAADDLADNDDLTLAKVDCTEHRDLCSKYGVRGFPTLKLFEKGQSDPSDYDAARKSDAIIKFMKAAARPAVTELTDDVAGFAKDQDVTIVAFLDADTDASAYAALAQKLRNKFVFGSTRNAGEAQEHGVTVPGVKLFRNFDDGNVNFEGSFTADDMAEKLEAFITEKSFPLIGEIGPDNYKQYLDRGLNFFWLFVDPDSAEQTTLVESLKDAAKSAAGKLSFVKLDGVRWVEHGKSFGWSGKTPGLIIEDREGKENYVFPDDKEANSASVSEFVSSFLDGSLAPTVKSEPIPESNDGPVKVVVALQYDEIVKDPTKNVFVEFYAPWCGHCKALAPKWEKLGEKYADDDEIVIAKIDATANKVPSDIQGFPTLRFYPAGADKSGIEYSGMRDVDDFVKFIDEKRKPAGEAAAAADASGDAPEAKEEL